MSNFTFIRFCWYFAYIRTFIDYIVFFWLFDTNVSRQALNKQSINYLYRYLSLVKLKNVVLDEKPLTAENQQVQPTLGVESGSRTQATLVEDDCSNHHVNHVPKS